MAFTKFDPHRPVADADDPMARRRAWILKWGMAVSQGMFYLGLLAITYIIGKQRHWW